MLQQGEQQGVFWDSIHAPASVPWNSSVLSAKLEDRKDEESLTTTAEPSGVVYSAFETNRKARLTVNGFNATHVAGHRTCMLVLEIRASLSRGTVLPLIR